MDFILVSLFFIFSLLYLLKLLRTEKLNLPPSPPKLPIIGNLHQLGTFPHRSLRSLSAKYGPLMLLYFGKTPTLVISSADVAQEIMKTHDLAFAGRFRTRAVEVITKGIGGIGFAAYGEYWRQTKKICVLELLSQKRVQAFQHVREEEVAKMVKKISLSCLRRALVDLSEMSLAIANTIVSSCAFGRAYEKEGSAKLFGKLSKMTIDLLEAFFFRDLFPFLGWIDVLTGMDARLKGTSKALHDFLDQVIEEHRVSMTSDNELNKRDIVDILLHLKKNGNFDMDLTVEDIKAILMDLFVAGTDTTAAVIEWAMAQLVKNPRTMEKAQEEVRRIVKKKSKLCEDDINEMTYLKCILKETLRLHAPAIVPRETSMATKLEGYDIPPKTRVFIHTWTIQRDPKLWEKPEDFIPERFANISIDFKGQQKQFMPFGGGRRVCPGISFAVAESEYVLANLLYWFNWEVPDAKPEDLNMDEANGLLVVHRKTPLLLVPSMHHLSM